MAKKPDCENLGRPRLLQEDFTEPAAHVEPVVFSCKYKHGEKRKIDGLVVTRIKICQSSSMKHVFHYGQ